MALRKGDAKHAIDLLEVTKPYELGMVNTSVMVTDLCSRHGLSESRPSEPRQRGSSRRCLPTAAWHRMHPSSQLALLQLARAQALAGDKPGARRSYQDLLALWKQADPDLLLLQAGAVRIRTFKKLMHSIKSHA